MQRAPTLGVGARLADSRGFEPLTPGSVDRCSIQLSHESLREADLSPWTEPVKLELELGAWHRYSGSHMRACLVGLVAVLGLGSSAGCGLTLDLEPEPDGSDADLGMPPGRDLGPRTDLGLPNPCEGAENGGACAIDGSEEGVCVDGRCVPGECGDGYLSGDELCDDGNTNDGDGCQANCRPGCANDEECESTECTMGRCVEGRCVSVPEPDGFNCSGGLCRSGMCAAPECGNGLLDDDELCDDGNAIDDDGCDTDCHPSCETNDECRDGIACNGVEVCASRADGGALCVPADVLPPAPRVCEYCDERTGDFELMDADGDGYTAVMAPGCGPVDCDDMNAAIHPGAAETTPGVDSDCDGEPAEDMVTICFRDEDGDGFGNPDLAMEELAGASCPIGFVPSGPADCNDGNDEVYPGQAMYFEDEWCGAMSGSCTYDYNCNEREERKYTERSACSGLDRAECEMGRVGWNGRRIPDCGETGNFGECQWTAIGCVTSLLPTTVVQSCR